MVQDIEGPNGIRIIHNINGVVSDKINLDDSEYNKLIQNNYILKINSVSGITINYLSLEVDKTKIVSINVRNGAVIDKITIRFADGREKSIGGLGGAENFAPVILNNDEYITKISWNISNNELVWIMFMTTKEKVYTYNCSPSHTFSNVSSGNKLIDLDMTLAGNGVVVGSINPKWNSSSK